MLFTPSAGLLHTYRQHGRGEGMMASAADHRAHHNSLARTGDTMSSTGSVAAFVGWGRPNQRALPSGPGVVSRATTCDAALRRQHERLLGFRQPLVAVFGPPTAALPRRL